MPSGRVRLSASEPTIAKVPQLLEVQCVQAPMKEPRARRPEEQRMQAPMIMRVPEVPQAMHEPLQLLLEVMCRCP